jgi:hypothetical protein
MFYSKSTNGFYSLEIHGESMPEDVLEITEEQYVALFDGQANGKKIVAGDDGLPTLSDDAISPYTSQNSVVQQLIEEQQTIINDLKARIETLENS